MTKLANKYPRLEVRHMLCILMKIGESLPVGRKNEVDTDFLFARTGYAEMHRTLFNDCLEFLIEHEWYRRMPRSELVYVL